MQAPPSLRPNRQRPIPPQKRRKSAFCRMTGNLASPFLCSRQPNTVPNCLHLTHERRNYFEQQPMLHVAFPVVAVAAPLPEQQPAEQLLESSSQQSQLQFSQVQTPLSQQQPPSGQQLVQAPAFAASVEGLTAKFAPIAIPIPTTHNSTSVAATFMFNYLIKFADSGLHRSTGGFF